MFYYQKELFKLIVQNKMPLRHVLDIAGVFNFGLSIFLVFAPFHFYLLLYLMKAIPVIGIMVYAKHFEGTIIPISLYANKWNHKAGNNVFVCWKKRENEYIIWLWWLKEQSNERYKDEKTIDSMGNIILLYILHINKSNDVLLS